MAERLREKPEKQGQADGQRDDEEDRRPPGLLLEFSLHARQSNGLRSIWSAAAMPPLLTGSRAADPTGAGALDEAPALGSPSECGGLPPPSDPRRCRDNRPSKAPAHVQFAP